jgi:Protein of unknown function (DUF2589)
MESGLLSIAQQFSGLPMEALIGGPLTAAAKGNSAMAVTQTKFLLDTCFMKRTIEKVAAVPGVAEVKDDKTGAITTAAVVATPEIPAHDRYEPIMIVMSLTRAVLTPGVPGKAEIPEIPEIAADPATGQAHVPAVPAVPAVPSVAPIINNFTTAFNLPMLTVVPLSSLGVESVDINFEMEVKSSFSEESSESKDREVKGEASFEAKAGYGPFSVSVRGSASYDQKDSSTHDTHYQKSNSAKYTVNVHAGQLPLPEGVTTIIKAFTSTIQPITMN